MIRSSVAIASSKRSRSMRRSACTVSASVSSGPNASARSQLVSASAERPKLAQQHDAGDQGRRHDRAQARARAPRSPRRPASCPSRSSALALIVERIDIVRIDRERAIVARNGLDMAPKLAERVAMVVVRLRKIGVRARWRARSSRRHQRIAPEVDAARPRGCTSPRPSRGSSASARSKLSTASASRPSATSASRAAP